MPSKNKKYVPKSFEADSTMLGDTSANIYMSMLLSKAWQSLTSKQQILYIYCKAQYYAEKKKPQSNQEYFTFNQSKWNSLYGLYTLSNKRMFYRDMEQLILKGFIKCIESGKNTRTKSVYAFSNKWKFYGENGVEILPSEMTSAMLKKLKRDI